MSLRRTTFLLGACAGLCAVMARATADEVCLSVQATVSELRPNAPDILGVPSLESGTPVTVELTYDTAASGSRRTFRARRSRRWRRSTSSR